MKNKTRDGRFREKRIRLPIGIIKNRIDEIKKDHNFTWKQFAETLNISEHTLRYDFRIKGNTLPFSVFQTILELNQKKNKKENINKKIKFLDAFWGQKHKNKANLKKIQQPELTEKYAEFFGAMLGDGCIFSNLSGICISGNSILDRSYLEKYVSPLIFKLFQLKPTIYYSNQSNSMRCIVYSKKIAEFLIQQKFPQGKKTFENLKIPHSFFKETKLLKACIRGLVDTDGSIFAHPNTRICLNISIYSGSLLNSCLKAFKKLNIKVGKYNKGINLYGTSKISNYFEKIGSSNVRNVLKYKIFKEKNYVPTSKEIESFLRENNTFSVKLPYHGPMV
ncbi:hypothetical protein JW851_02250 [Candidatus Woesearchaeota archaeon]|nr:hypothetical protein [Candidatus Woesearchaeota archaeon]